MEEGLVVVVVVRAVCQLWYRHCHWRTMLPLLWVGRIVGRTCGEKGGRVECVNLVTKLMHDKDEERWLLSWFLEVMFALRKKSTQYKVLVYFPTEWNKLP